MIAYYDSSVLLAALFAQQSHVDLASLWDEAKVRLSSNVLKVECVIGVRRAGLLQPEAAREEWIDRRVEALDRYFSAFYFKQMDEGVEWVVRRTRLLADCRALDAIHLATALYFAPHVEAPLYVVTLDQRMKSVALRLGFEARP